MKSATRFALPILFVTLFSFGGNAQKNAVKYTDYNRGYSYFYYGKKDSAFLYLNRYITNADDTLNKGWSYIFIGELEWKSGDLYGAQESLLAGIHILEPPDTTHYEELGYAYNVLGNVSLDLKRYDEAIEHYYKAILFLKGTDRRFETINGIATAFQKKGDYDKAVMVYDSVLNSKPADQLLIARLIDNLAHTKWQRDAGYHAAPEFWTALKIRTDSLDNLGLNASYAHLADYYTTLNRDSALWYANKMREQATANESPDDVLEAIDKLIRLNSAPAAIEQWYATFKKLNDSLQLARDTTRNRFALIRYDVQKGKADNLVLQQDITKQRLLIFGVILLAAGVIIGLGFRYRKRRERIKQESENAIRNARLKTSQKVHDVVANGLYGIMNELEHSNTIDREPLIDKIDRLYEKSRNISYEDVVADTPADYDKQISRLLSSFANEQTKVITVGDQQTFWSNITGAQKHELYLVLNEIMINMQKHSQAKNVVIQFKQEHNKGFIHYKDDGVGFNAGQKFGNGLHNTVSRIKTLNGEVNFEKPESGGISIAISFPLQS